MSPHRSGTLAEVLRFNRAVLGQALVLLDLHVERRDVAFGDCTGPHLRHVIEHYEAFLYAVPGAPISYDARQRDAQLEQHVEVARKRLGALLTHLEQWNRAQDETVTTLLRCGLDGSAVFESPSSVGRELMFLACHAIHHYALIQRTAVAVGLSLPEGFGKAPATVHHEARRAAAEASA